MLKNLDMLGINLARMQSSPQHPWISFVIDTDRRWIYGAGSPSLEARLFLSELLPEWLFLECACIFIPSSCLLLLRAHIWNRWNIIISIPLLEKKHLQCTVWTDQWLESAMGHWLRLKSGGWESCPAANQQMGHWPAKLDGAQPPILSHLGQKLVSAEFPIKVGNGLDQCKPCYQKLPKNLARQVESSPKPGPGISPNTKKHHLSSKVSFNIQHIVINN